MQEAVKAQRARNTNQALRAYQVSINADPTYFDAQYNAALLALQAGDLNHALAGWETALALEPDSLNARYNFALALKQANYMHDAAVELERILEAKPNDSRAHLTLANLYSQQLNERGKARVHYMKLLELEPRNPQAPAIRFWLASNP
jgi:tetratricopeptide (TPR) repeat protein